MIFFKIGFLLFVLILKRYVYGLQQFIDINSYLNNKAASGSGSNFDGLGNYLKCLNNDTLSIGTIRFKRSSSKEFDSILCKGQIISFTNQSNYGALYLLGAVSHGPITTHIKLVYQDGSESITELNLPDWQTSHPQQIHRLDHTSCLTSLDSSNGSLLSIPLLLDPTRSLSHLFLPVLPALGSFRPILHLFSITALPATDGLTVVAAKGTRRWYSRQRQYPIVTVRIQNLSPEWFDQVSVVLQGSLFKTKYPGFIKRIAPGHITQVDIALYTISKTRFTSSVEISLLNKTGMPFTSTTVIHHLDIGNEEYEETEASLNSHSVPEWFESAKFGIFIHWGVYSIPSWAPVGQNYAEWYWWNYNQKGSPSYRYHRTFYGPDIEYDDFIPVWKPDRFDPNQWLKLIQDSGAKYFVFTSKHHDGIALFDTKVSNRSSAQLNPHRDFVKELFDEANRSFPDLKKGIYFSLPEWFHPNYLDQSIHWSGPPKNPYTGRTVNYLGAPKIKDFVNELQVPQIMELIQNFEPDIMWCDIGGINNSTSWQAKFLNLARDKGRQVTMNDRCGNSVSDFSTVEYSSVNYVPNKFWEATRGIDPYSFGYNHQTKPEQYTSSTDIIKEIVSTVAKGGNFLLNIGPEASGHIPDMMRQKLLEIGGWITRVKESLFQSEPYWVTSSDFHEPGQPLYFTQSKDGESFYIFSLEKPLGRLVVKTKVPLHHQSRISLLPGYGESLDWRIGSNDKLIIQTPTHIVNQETKVWVFKIENKQ